MMQSKAVWLTRLRQVVAFGLLTYIASFFFIGPSQQKTLFYLLVAAPSIFLLVDFREILKNHRTSLSCILLFVAYFALSSLWSDEGSLLNGLKLALCFICLLLAVHSTMNLRFDSEKQVRYFILIVGVVAACFYFFLIASKITASAEHTTIWSERHSLHTSGGWGDSNPINSAIYFGLVTLAAWWNFPQGSRLTKVCLLLLIVTCMALMLLTKSRGPLVSLVLVISLISLLRRHKADLVLWGAALITGTLAITYFDLVPLIVDRASSPNYRVGIWLNAIEQIKDNPLFGRGLGDSANIPIFIKDDKIVTVGHSHSSILETFRVGGLIGGALFFAMVLSIAHQSLRKNKECAFPILWLFFGLLCLSTNGRLPFIRPSVEWFAFWIPLFLALFTPVKASTDDRYRYDQ